MTGLRFHSILFDRRGDGAGVDGREEPPFFADLNLDQVLASMTAGRDEYRLAPFFYAPLHDVAAVRYRHEVLRDLEKHDLLESIRAFAQKMQEVEAGGDQQLDEEVGEQVVVEDARVERERVSPGDDDRGEEHGGVEGSWQRESANCVDDERR